MKPQNIRLIDRWLGQPLCGLLTLVRVATEPFHRRRDPARPIRKILLIKLTEQGATVLAYRAILRAVKLVGRENVYFWVFEENRAILDLLDLIPPENILAVRSSHILPFLVDIFRSIRRIRRIGIDSTVDMEFFTRAPAILGYLTGADRRVGLHRFTSEGPDRGNLMTHRVQYNPYLHTAVAYYMLVEALARQHDETPALKCPPEQMDMRAPQFKPSDEEVKRVQATLHRIAGRSVERPIVLLNPNTSDLLPVRRWPTERFVELGKQILADYPAATVVVTGSPSERDAASDIAVAIGSDRVVCMAGETTLRELMILYTLADVLVTNDSGPGHFASMTEIDSVCLFGPETPVLYGPLGNHSHVMRAGLTCSPCSNVYNHRFSPCRDPVCMQAISVSQVYAKVCQLLSARGWHHAECSAKSAEPDNVV